MKRRIFLTAAAPLLAITYSVFAQSLLDPASDLGGPPGRLAVNNSATKPAAGPAEATAEKPPRGPTEITSLEAMLDSRKNLAIFNGEVVVKDPEYNLTCDKLTVYLKDDKKKDGGDAKPGQPQPIGADPVAERPDKGAKPGENAEGQGGGIERAVAEGNVVIIQDRVNAKGEKQRYYGKARRAVFDNEKKTCVLHGWPRIAETVGNGTMGKETFALDETTVITLEQAGTITVKGQSTTRLTDVSGFGPPAGGGGRNAGGGGGRNANGGGGTNANGNR